MLVDILNGNVVEKSSADYPSQIKHTVTIHIKFVCMVCVWDPSSCVLFFFYLFFFAVAGFGAMFWLLL